MPTSVPDRPSRRDQLASIAAELFAQKGFHNVSVNDIAAAAGVSGPAIYRHFKRKQAKLAAFVVERPKFGVLWRREGRYLSAEDRVDVSDAAARGTDPLVRELDRS